MCKVAALIMCIVLWQQSGSNVRAENTNASLCAEDNFYYLVGKTAESKEYSCRKQSGDAYIMGPCPFQQRVDDSDRYKFYMVRSLALAYNRDVEGTCMVFNKPTKDAVSMSPTESNDPICQPKKPGCTDPAQEWIARRGSSKYIQEPILLNPYHFYHYGKNTKIDMDGTSVCGPSGLCQGKGYVKKFDFEDLDAEYTTFLVDTNEILGMPSRCESLSFFILSKPEERNLDDDSRIRFDNEHFPLLKSFSASYLSVHEYICVFLCVFGILTNVINFVILRRREMRSPVNIVLSHIAICDLGTMISYMILVVWLHIWSLDPHCHSRGYSKNLMNFVLLHSSWSVLMHTTSIWLAVLLALVRLAVMKRSNLGNKLFKVDVCKWWILCILVLVLLLGFPIALTNQIVKVNDLPTCEYRIKNDTVRRIAQKSILDYYTVNVSSLALKHDCALLRFTLWTNGIFFKLGPCIVLMVAVFGLLRTVDKAKKRRMRLSSDYSHDPQNPVIDEPKHLQKISIEYRQRCQSFNQQNGFEYSSDQSLGVRSSNQHPIGHRTWRIGCEGHRNAHTFRRSLRFASYRSVGNGMRNVGGRLLGRTRSNRSSSTTSVRMKQFSPRTTKMLVAILLIFIATELPQAVLTTASSLFTHDLHFHVYPLIGDMFDMLSLLNSSVNFVLYCAMSSKYRTTFKRIMKSTIIFPRSKIQNGDISTQYHAVHGNSCKCPRLITPLNQKNTRYPENATNVQTISTSRKFTGHSDKTASYSLIVSKMSK